MDEFDRLMVRATALEYDPRRASSPLAGSTTPALGDAVGLELRRSNLTMLDAFASQEKRDDNLAASAPSSSS